MHLFVILTNRCQHGFHLWVSITSIKEAKAYDAACTFAGGEHPFLDKPSYVYYRLAEQKRGEAIVKGVASGLFIPREDMPEAGLKAICDGIDASEFIGRWAIEYYHDNRNN